MLSIAGSAHEAIQTEALIERDVRLCMKSWNLSVNNLKKISK
jgi:hypothetical protein